MKDDDVAWLESLDAEKLQEAAQRIREEFNKEDFGSIPESRALVKFYESKHGPLVVRHREITSDDLLLLPIHEDGIAVVDVKTVPNQNRLVPVQINPDILPATSRLQSVLMDMPEKPSRSHIAGGKTSGDSVFGFDEDLGDDRPVDEEPLEEASRVKDFKLGTRADLKLFLDACLGSSVLDSARQKLASKSDGYPIGYLDMCGERPQAAADTIDEALQDVAGVRAVADLAPLQPTSLDDAKERRKAEVLRKRNEIDGWFGMKRRRITPEDRAELQALELRGFIDIKKRYRGAKRRDPLVSATSGFYQFGTVVAGGLTDAKVGEDVAPRNLRELGSRKKATKTLVKSILQV